MSLQHDAIGNAWGEGLLVVGDHDEGLVAALAEGVDDFLYHFAVEGVESVQGLVEDEQLGVLDEGAGQEYQALLAAGELQEGAVGKVFDAKEAHPHTADVVVLF